MMDPIKVTMLDTATLFEGAETIYRYDLPGSGVVEGWALNAVVEQLRHMSGDHWPNVEVIVAGNERATEMLTRTLLNKGVAAYGIEALEEPDYEPDVDALSEMRGGRGARSEENRDPIRRSTSEKNKHRARPQLPEFSLFHAAVAAVIIGVGAISWWGIDTAPRINAEESSARESSAKASQIGGESSKSKGGVGPSTVTSASNSFAQATPPGLSGATPSASSGADADRTRTVIAEHSNIRVELPPGFALSQREDGAIVAEGPDPNLRILLAADPIYGLDPAAVRKEIELMVSRDPNLSPLSAENWRGRETQTVDYKELPGDGSEVHWVAWAEADHQFSVGCHSRNAPTIPHKTACRQAVQTFALK